ncbi:hypothetical protein A3B51_00960 [Candidatus Curtissbacteria bacterium RIFCSPLOWO2_01_FULL_41_18]|uniref:Four helix bundle protein n=1 Tax=Candidatus Curtissbacteria bacterium RIFCSPLOWO2_01_FULL_41_18 TaxID=1797727 RepID=A0A1F5HN70_9BACT|nr:MAG: hypothetical protein A3B51_00960 [Candidatus Curtissbacteria bacterium RIFCSPLOWO2_01_FULL_41_18]
MDKIKSFTDLNVWKEGHKFVLLVYKLTENFPTGEKFGLVNQLRRAAVSVTSNISEGFSRGSRKEKIQFYRMALGSLAESQNQLIISKDLGYLSEGAFKQVFEQSTVVTKLLLGTIKSARSF